MTVLPQPSAAKATVHFRSLGCPKNRVDSEVMLGTLALGGYAVAERLDDADVVVINTCSFIESARQESIDAILAVAELRETGRLRALIVAGCLPQRYGGELSKELPEVDAFVGTGEFPRIAEILDGALAGRRGGVYVEAGSTYLLGARDPRILVGPNHTAYLKIAEGCDRVCAFCAIPGIRGRFQSRTLESLLTEARQLSEAGVRELNLIAQDSTSWGKDLPASEAGGRPRLDAVLRGLDEVDGLDWIRLLYVYPSAVTDELIAALASGRRVLPYVDVPLQHASDSMLRAMKRGTTADRQRRLVERLRAEIPDVAIRTTFIVGFPGESDDSVQASLDAAKRLRGISPDFQTPFFYFKPYPGTEITEAVVKDGFSTAQTLDEWAAFDFVGNVGGPWVSDEKFARIERFKYFQQVAWDRAPLWRRPLQQIARWRCAGDRYSLPLEMWIDRALWPAPRLS